MKETSTRSLLKAISYRVVASLVTAGLVFAVTGQVALALGMGLLDSLVKIGVFYFHERLWAWIPIGHKSHPLAGINVNGKLSPEHHALIERQLADLGYRTPEPRPSQPHPATTPELKPDSTFPRQGSPSLATPVALDG